jgi:hypothetical protein
MITIGGGSSPNILQNTIYLFWVFIFIVNLTFVMIGIIPR